MVKHNNVLPNVHLRKEWSKHVKTWFDQPGRKKRRHLTRLRKAAAISPRPTGGMLRPIVHCPSQRHNMRVRAGRGFTLEEIKAVGLSKQYARSVGIAVDHRRRNKSEESLKLNTDRLKLYLEKLVLFPVRGGKPHKGDSVKETLSTATQNTHKNIIPIPRTQV
eukprot:GHVR01119120.1.p1 GENE.GHVR01119120.1~~GHVR01119120.1.p1  ORF type:complete len:163 (+),score=36.23 GHVR01119120.1:50-538(+)